MNKLLIFDLDDTLFETKSMDEKTFEPIFNKFESSLIDRFGKKLAQQILPELWKYPFDFVSEKHKFGNDLDYEFASLINKHEYELDIKTFKDFNSVESLKHEKILVTTGFLKLQNAKIYHLGIKEKFSNIYIDDILDPKRIYKKGIFNNILLDKKIDSKLVYVIGDNPNSELKAGFELGFNTIQVAKFGQKKSKYSNHYISDLEELITILN